jgi:hypothetical protein
MPVGIHNAKLIKLPAPLIISMPAKMREGGSVHVEKRVSRADTTSGRKMKGRKNQKSYFSQLIFLFFMVARPAGAG